jgi:hypothetical protein
VENRKPAPNVNGSGVEVGAGNGVDVGMAGADVDVQLVRNIVVNKKEKARCIVLMFMMSIGVNVLI